ncbi:MAG TPA: 4'-phosphopantetheinyl transferase superfamily protein [Stellaceae bacterium]|jgi:4'-phosphopantetheinyl transferase|nr:4'-phosphopantetheinyl transferase superfamily protein [Stellaceae bacterium]
MMLPIIDDLGILPPIGAWAELALVPEWPELGPREVHVWAVIGTDSPDAARRHRQLLSEEELARAQRFIQPSHGIRFTRSHAALRLVLSRYTAQAPEALVFDKRAGGKPVLVEHPAIEFNLAHSEEATVVAVTRAGDIGVDVEALRPMDDADGLVERFFSAYEFEAYMALPPALREAAFFTAWTRKEAYVKALGEGLATPLDSFSVNTDVPARLLEPVEPPWTFRHLDLSSGYVGALASPVAGLALRGGRIEL